MTAPFDVAGPLPTGVTVLEASAGTGKTYTIAALAARYVAEGTPLDRLLLVTFTRMATGELRERVRERLVSVERCLDGVVAGDAPANRDEVARLLARGSDDEVRLRRDRLRRALTDFDAATIETTHGFCQEVLGGLGIAGDLERDVTFVEDVSDLVEEVVNDLYVRRFFRGDPPPFGRNQAAKIVRTAVDNPVEEIVMAVGGVPQMRRRLAEVAREELELRKRRMAIMTYDDLLTRLADALSGESGAAAAARLRARYDVVLVDEFQDTDPTQWEIMQGAFGEGGTTLVLIGDPKQAVYAFRGADVYAYLRAAQTAATRCTLDINWRSDQGLIDAYDAMFGGARLGHEGIVYRQVRAAPANRQPRLTGGPHSTPVRIRVVERGTPGVTLTRGGFASNASAREYIADDLAADLVELLSSDATIARRSDDGAVVGEPEPIRPRHLAVLVRTNRNAALIREALEKAGVPAVINGAGSVFATPPAREWLRLLEAIERPTSPARARSAALTCFFGWSTEQVAGASDEDWEGVHLRLHEWARVLRVKGVASLAETITLVERLPERVLATEDGERRLTDLRHIGQLRHAEAAAEHIGTTALTAWLRRRIAEAEQDTSDEERSRRLESDAEAVQVLTIHRSKGLEFPIVYAPYLWDPTHVPKHPVPVTFHDPANDDRRTIDVGLE
ncbi:MAG TPA: UvrD-helicase domain-containing protein, partial [Solirubrobacteraceae bacterium]|nr:UvrD-helicase domain-containing protein [Solirubrobacteraceae bacterium]